MIDPRSVTPQKTVFQSVTPRSVALALATACCFTLFGTATAAPAVLPATPASEATPVATEVVALAASKKIPAFEKSLLKEINAARAKARKCGSTKFKAAKSLAWNSKLAGVAEKHSVDMSKRNYLSHFSKNGASPFTRIKKAGYKYQAAGETIAGGLSTPKSVVNAWLKSPSHCKALMNPKYTQVGLGYYKGSGAYRYYTTADFGRPKK